MPAVVRKGDPLSTGHECVGSTTLAGPAQSPSVFANGSAMAVVGAPTVSHEAPPNPPCAPHVANLNAGSPDVFVEGIPQGRVGDSADAGAMTGGSPDVFAN